MIFLFIIHRASVWPDMLSMRKTATQVYTVDAEGTGRDAALQLVSAVLCKTRGSPHSTYIYIIYYICIIFPTGFSF